MQHEINKLSDLITIFVKESSLRATKLEESYTVLSNAIRDITKTTNDAILSNNKLTNQAVINATKLESKIVSLEDKALDKLALVEDSINDTLVIITDLRDRVYKLEIAEAKCIAANEVKHDMSSSISDNWFKVFMVVVISLPVLVYLYTGVINMVEKAKGVHL